MADAVLSEEPWFGYYWGPTVPLGKYDMTKIDLGEVNDESTPATRTPTPTIPAFPTFRPRRS